MTRLLTVAVIAGGTALLAQEPRFGTLPAGPRGGPVEVVSVLFLQAQVIDDGRVMFLFPRGDQEPALLTKVDGKTVKALDRDGKALTAAEVGKRLSGYTPVVVVPAEFAPPDPFFLKALDAKTVVFALPRTQFAPMAKAAEFRHPLGVPRE
ncbi:MAG TPA: hypothetical protein VD866_11810 [Urbifossiella sp.]|nr:hypothetical protein [Urbifossiella sp.]